MSTLKWNSDNIPNQNGKVVVITGATSGLGKEATKILAEKDAKVVMAVRNTQKAEGVVQELKRTFPNAKIDIKQLELNSLKSVQAFAEGMKNSYNRLDILINNAGVMACPFSKTEDGFEMHIGVNHLGHFALTGHLMPLLEKTKSSRIVVTSSIAHRIGKINFDDINWNIRSYKRAKAYGDSKLANLYFAYELVRKLKDKANAPMITMSHPGWTKTELDRHSGVAYFFGNFLAQTVEMGTLPTLIAAIDEKAKTGNYYGPSKLFEIIGHPLIVKSNKLSHNEENAKRLWTLSENLTGVKY